MNFVIFIWTLKTFSSDNENPMEVTTDATIEGDHSNRKNSESEIVSPTLTDTISNQDNATNGEDSGNIGYFESLSIKSLISMDKEQTMTLLVKSFYGKKDIWTFDWKNIKRVSAEKSEFEKTKLNIGIKRVQRLQYLTSIFEHECKVMLIDAYRAMEDVYDAKSEIYNSCIVVPFKNKKVEFEEKLSLHDEILQIWAELFKKDNIKYEDLIDKQLIERKKEIENEFVLIQRQTYDFMHKRIKNQSVLISASLTGSKVEMETAQKNNTILNKKEMKKHVCKIKSMMKKINDQYYIQEQENAIATLIFRYNNVKPMFRTYELECKKLWKNLENDVPNSDKIENIFEKAAIVDIIKSAYKTYESKKEEHDVLMKRLKKSMDKRSLNPYHDLYLCEINKIALFKRYLEGISPLLLNFAHRMEELIIKTNQIIYPAGKSSVQITKEELDELRFLVHNSNGELRKRKNNNRQKKTKPHFKGKKTHKDSNSVFDLQSIANNDQ